MKTTFKFEEKNLVNFMLARFKETGDYYFIFQLLNQYVPTQEVWDSLKKEFNINEEKLEQTRKDFQYKSLDELSYGLIEFFISDDGIQILREISKQPENDRIPVFNGYYNFCKGQKSKTKYQKYIEKYILKKLEERNKNEKI